MYWSKCLCALVLCLSLALSPVNAEGLPDEVVIENVETLSSQDIVSESIPIRGAQASRASIRARAAQNAAAPSPTSDSLSPSVEILSERDDNVLADGNLEAIPRASCPAGYWYSSKYGKCYYLYGDCYQYDYTDSSTCQNGYDNVLCQWDPYKKWCNPKCKSYEWYSSKYGKCYNKYGKCWQYDSTSETTCENSYDTIGCQWDPYKQWCNSICSSGYWYSTIYGECYNKNGQCSQYDGTDASTCTNGADSIACKWIPSKQWCDPK